MSHTTFGNTWNKAGTATTTVTTDALAVWDANGSRPRKVDVLNDGSVDLLVQVHIGGAVFTIAPGESSLFNTISDGLTVEAASGTCAFRAHAEG